MKIPESWEVIAESHYTGVHDTGLSRWVSLPDAAMTVTDARGLYADGVISMAQKRLPSGRMGLLVKKKGK